MNQIGLRAAQNRDGKRETRMNRAVRLKSSISEISRIVANPSRSRSDSVRTVCDVRAQFVLTFFLFSFARVLAIVRSLS